MSRSNYDVVVVGAGAAGLTAAIGLARAGFAVAVVEAAVYPGAENWSGCVYFCENLADPCILGPEGVEALAWERRLVERGLFATDGYGLLGMRYRDPQAFRNCYTVLRPIFDHHLGQLALGHGVALLTSTTAESLIREGGQVIGLGTNRGPLYADLVFLAEGDASQLVTREGYERRTDPSEAPHFLQGIKQVIELPPGAIEERFGVGPEEGAAYEILLRNGTLRGRSIRLNMGGFVYTNRQSLSIGLVLPADHLAENFGGDPNLLMEWFEGLPVLKPWLSQGRRGTFGAKLIRGGGARDIPNLIDHGLAIGGAASAIGIDFPYPNFTGPATAMGLLLVQAACRIREEKRRFTQEALHQHYLEPLQKTHYWQDVQFLRRWPGYVKRTEVFFGRNIDLSLGTAHVWTRTAGWLGSKWIDWLRLVGQVAGRNGWPEIRADLKHLGAALRLREVVGQPGWGRLSLDGTVNALRDLFRSPRPHLPPAGDLTLHYSVADETAPTSRAPAILRHRCRRYAPILASAARRIYANNERPLQEKLAGAIDLLIRQVNVLDLMAVGGLAALAGLTSVLLTGWDWCKNRLVRSGSAEAPRGSDPCYALAARQASDLTSVLASANQHWEDRLGQLAYLSVKASHIQVLWPRTLAERNAVTQEGLWHVCPARVYEARMNAMGQVQVVVNFENCIKCETCWRTSDRVDWRRDGSHRFIYAVSSPVMSRLLAEVQTAGLARPARALAFDCWEDRVQELGSVLRAEASRAMNGQAAQEAAELLGLVDKLERKLREFDEALAEGPRTIDRTRADYLEMLARYAQQLAVRIVEVLQDSRLNASPQPGITRAWQQLRELAIVLAARAEERVRRTWNQRFAWAAADGRQVRQHHLHGLRRLLQVVVTSLTGPITGIDHARSWLRAEENTAKIADRLSEWRDRLDRVMPAAVWRDLERQAPLDPEQDATLRDLLAEVPRIDRNDPSHTLHPPLRKALLAELGRRDPSLAYRAACHLWARDLAGLATGSASLSAAADRWARGDEWACFAILDATPTTAGGWTGEALFVPARGARWLLLLMGDRLVLVTSDAPGVNLEPVATLGLRGAGLARVRLVGSLAEPGTTVDPKWLARAWNVLGAADLTSIAFGMADQLCRRAIAHATSRVQFPGLFHDEQARDTIGKFGAIKRMVAEMAIRRYLIETLDHQLSPIDFTPPSVAQAGLVKALTAEALGTAPGSLAYNAGQIFGGTGYSEDDILAKFYRDASAWRFLGPRNGDVYRRHGEDLLSGWSSDGQRLATLPGEAELLGTLAQRKALQAELDEVRVGRSRLRGLVNERLDAEAAPASACFVEGLARQDALHLASKALLFRTHARLEQGLPSQVEWIFVPVWLESVSAAMDEFESAVRSEGEPIRRRQEGPIVEASPAPLVTVYGEYLAADLSHDSGDFLEKPVDLTLPRLVPEMIETDPDLSRWNREIRELLAGHFGQPRSDGLPYERHIERRHHPAPADLDFCRRHGFFRMPIPRDLGGEGRSKAEYSLLTTNAQRLADVAISLTIQASTSIGTTPILLARDKDLPRAEKDLAPFVGDTDLQSKVRRQLEELLHLLASPDPAQVEQAYLDLDERLKKTILKRTVLRSLAAHFLEAWQRAGECGLRLDLPGRQTHLGAALDHWNQACDGAEDLHEELKRRREACDLFLRWIASGQISAFALTEPSAGSDTARVATRAVLRSVPIEVEPDGVLRFVPEGEKTPRHLLDARRLEFRPDGVRYRWSNDTEPALIHFGEYDCETADPRCLRYYDHGARRVHFADIAQLRRRDNRLWYDYWELTGAKMWITNGRMAGVMCLYAKTPEGVTGFLVDRHAEGLTVGKDEAKLGQLGSPTNELALQAVRVPRENVLGLEGRGQVNALETLNVGRAGLAMSAMAQMEGLIEQSRAFAQNVPGELPGWVAWRLRRMEEGRFIAEAVGWEVVGRFEHPRTQSVRMESSIAKMLVSELLHHVIELAEEIHGLAGQTELHLIEKRKRDARILTIYEGTNDVQRFSILKDLAAEPAPRWSAQKAAAPAPRPGSPAQELEALQAAVRERVATAVRMFGQELWQNPNLQASCFLLAEAVAWLKATDSVLGRLAWLGRRANETVEGMDRSLANKLEIGRGALASSASEVRHRLRRFDDQLARLRHGFYHPVIRVADLLFDRPLEQVVPVLAMNRITRPLSVLVLVEPGPACLPEMHVIDGQLRDPHWILNEADRSALEAALQLRDMAPRHVKIQVAAVGPRAAGQPLRELLALEIDSVRLVVTEADVVAADVAAAALAGLCRAGTGFDLILGGAGRLDQDEGQIAPLTAALLKVPLAGTAAQMVVQADGAEAKVQLVAADGRRRTRALPAAIAIEPGLLLRPFMTPGYLAATSRNVEAERWPRRLEGRPLIFASGSGQSRDAAEEPPRSLTPREAAHRLLSEAGLQSNVRSAVRVFEGTIEDMDIPTWGQAGVLAVMGADAEGRITPGDLVGLRAAAWLAREERLSCAAFLLGPQAESAQRRALGQVRTVFGGEVVLLTVGCEGCSTEVRAALLGECWSVLPLTSRLVAGGPWTEAAFALGSAHRTGGDRQPDFVAARIRRVTKADRTWFIESSRAGGRLTVRRPLLVSPEFTTWLTFAGDLEIDQQASRSALVGSMPGRVQRWQPRLERFYGSAEIERLLGELRREIGAVRLTDADFVIDVGFGIGNRDGYDEVIEPLERALRELGVRNLAVGGSRKVTEELHLLPVDRQIGQSGVSVNPRILLAVGISGAPQHLQSIGPRTTLLAFNRDPEAPIMTLNRRQPRPRVFPVVGDLFRTVPALTAALQQEQARAAASAFVA